LNISPDNYNGDDQEFPRGKKSLGEGGASYGGKGNTWIKMHDTTDNFQVLGSNIRARDIK